MKKCRKNIAQGKKEILLDSKNQEIKLERKRVHIFLKNAVLPTCDTAYFRYGKKLNEMIATVVVFKFKLVIYIPHDFIGNKIILL